MDFSAVVPWIAVLISMLSLIFGRSDKGRAEDEEMKKANVQMQFDIKEIRLMLENMNNNHEGQLSRQQAKDVEQDEALAKLQARNSESHAKLHAKIDELTKTVDKRLIALEQQCALMKERFGDNIGDN